jgi:hypothetical protein
MKSYVVRRIFVNGALDVECLHQADGSERQADASLQDTSAQLTEFQASAAEIENESGRVQISQRTECGHADEAGLLLPRDDFEIDFCLVA